MESVPFRSLKWSAVQRNGKTQRLHPKFTASRHSCVSADWLCTSLTCALQRRRRERRVQPILPYEGVSHSILWGHRDSGTDCTPSPKQLEWKESTAYPALWGIILTILLKSGNPSIPGTVPPVTITLNERRVQSILHYGGLFSLSYWNLATLVSLAQYPQLRLTWVKESTVYPVLHGNQHGNVPLVTIGLSVGLGQYKSPILVSILARKQNTKRI